MHRSLAVAVVSLWGMIAVTPAAAISIDFVPAAQTRFLGEAVSVGVVVSGLLGPTPDQVVSGFDLDVLYNPAILTATGVTFSAFLGGPLDGRVTAERQYPAAVADTLRFVDCESDLRRRWQRRYRSQ